MSPSVFDKSRSAFVFLSLLLGPSSRSVGADVAERHDAIFTVRTADGKTLHGPIRELTEDWSSFIGEGKGFRLAGAEVLSLRRAETPLPPFPSGKQLWLHGGDRLPVRDVKLDGERLLFRHPELAGGEETSVPLSGVAVYWLTAPATANDPEIFLRKLAGGTRARDRVLLRNGDVLEGVLGSLEGDKLTVEVNQKTANVDLAQVAAVAPSTELAEALRPKKLFARLTLLGGESSRGTRVSLRSASCTDGRILEGETAFGSKVRVPVEQMASLDFIQGKAVYLSDLKYSKYEHQPFFDVGWPLVIDGSVTGGDLRLKGNVFDKGLGMHSRSRVTYALTEPFRRFEALVGLDEKSGQHGSVRIRVLANGKPLDLEMPEELTAKNGPIVLSVSLKSAKELTLEVDFGAGGDIGDRVNWADARLVK